MVAKISLCKTRDKKDTRIVISTPQFIVNFVYVHSSTKLSSLLLLFFLFLSIIVLTEAHRALELLEDYHSRLGAQQDRALRIAIERVIRIFKSRLFQALLGECFMIYL